MNKYSALFIAYKTVEVIGQKVGGQFMRFEKAIIFLGVCVCVNLAQAVLIAMNYIFNYKIQVTPLWYIILISFGTLVTIPLKLIFTKAILAKGIARYKDSNLSDNARAIGLLYFLINFILVIYLFNINQKLN